MIFFIAQYDVGHRAYVDTQDISVFWFLSFYLLVVKLDLSIVMDH